MAVAHHTTMPASPRDAISRPRLIKMLDQSSSRALTVITAPAGFGKTTLLSEWCALSDGPIAWASLESADNDVFDFARKITAATSFLLDSSAETAEARQQQFSPITPVYSEFEALIDAAVALDSNSYLILDDYHHITSRAINEALVWLVSHLPDKLHLIIATRTVLPFSRASWRAKGQLLEISSTDLAFVQTEIEELSSAGQMGLSPSQCKRLYEITEGWPACIQLVKLRLDKLDEDQRTNYLERLDTGEVYLRDYLSLEILSHQTSVMQDFMIRTSILPQMSGPICNYIREATDSEELLYQLAHNGLVKATDETCKWFTYPSVLRNYLIKELERKVDREAQRRLHKRASQWYELRGNLTEAANSALAAGNIDHAWRLLDEHFKRLDFSGDPSPEAYLPWRMEYLELTDETLLEEPELCLSAAMSCYLTHDLEHLDRPLSLAEATFRHDGNSAGLGRVYSIKAAVCIDYGKGPEAVEWATMALELLPDDMGSEYHASAQLSLSRGYYLTGQYRQALEWAQKAYEAYVQTRNIRKAAVACMHLAEVNYLMGKMNEAAELCEQIINKRSAVIVSEKCSAHACLGAIEYDRNNLESAESHLTTATEFPGNLRTGRYKPFGYTGLAKIYAVREEFDKVDQILEKAIEHSRPRKGWSWEAHIKATASRIALSRGSLEKATELVESVRPASEDSAHRPDRTSVSYAAMYLALARGKAARSADPLNDLRGSLVKLIPVLESEGNGRGVIETSIILAITCHLLKLPDEALSAISHAMELAQPEKIIRSFSDSDPIIEYVLKSARDANIHPDFAEVLLATLFARQQQSPPGEASVIASQITAREREILKLISRGSGTADIAQAFVISEATVRTHIRNILSKLGVHTRLQAVEKARELGLI